MKCKKVGIKFSTFFLIKKREFLNFLLDNLLDKAKFC